MAINYLDELSKVRQDYGQRLADYPNMSENIRKNIYGGDTVLPTLRSTRDSAIQKLWDVDKRLADRYSNPESDTFIRDPYAREKLAAQQFQSEFGAVSGADRLVQNREDLLGNLLDKSLEILKLNLSGKATEHSMLIDELNASLKGGGAGNLDLLSVLAYLRDKNKKAPETNAQGLTPQEMFKARILSGENTLPVKAPTPEVGPLGTVLNPIVSLINNITGRNAPPIQKIPQDMSMNIPGTVNLNPDVIQSILKARPGYEPPLATEEEGTGSDLSALSGLLGGSDINLPLLTYISNADPKFADTIAQKYIQNALFPSTKEDKAQTDITAPANREALNSILAKVEKFSSGVDDAGKPLGPNDTALSFYKQMVQLYPEIDAQSIQELLTTISPSFALINQ